ncbi:DUF4190 domain-containing protein [Ihubacter sp. mB4P-1]|uniref:DUF4190 domain-containing protein n=1 Tax=Ihubacter sp. mB4P-1 TaxID=3242370 RepID=UPI003C7A675B
MKEKEFDRERTTTMVDFDYDRYAEVEYKATHTDAVASLTCGVLSIVSVFYLPVGIIAGIIGIIFGIRSLCRNSYRQGMAIAGLICSVLGLLIAAVMTIMAVFVFDLFSWL